MSAYVGHYLAVLGRPLSMRRPRRAMPRRRHELFLVVVREYIYRVRAPVFDVMLYLASVIESARRATRTRCPLNSTQAGTQG